jgi:hypothetical protein
MSTQSQSAAARFLVIVRAGRLSLHRRWLCKTERLPFDLLIAAYEEIEASRDRPEVQHVLIPGPKVRGLAELFRQRPGLLRDYSHIALIDDDMDVGHADLMRCFQIGVEHGLDIWQPSMTWNSYFSYAISLNNPAYQIRYCNFVEMGMPFFTSNALARCLPLFALGYETGIDQLWCRLSPDPEFKYAVVDSVSVCHTRAVGSTAAVQGFYHSYDDDLRSLNAKFNTRFRGPVVYGGILANGIRFKSRFLAACLALCTLPGFFVSPVGHAFFMMRLLDHVRHNLTRPVNNSPLIWPAGSLDNPPLLSVE